MELVKLLSDSYYIWEKTISILSEIWNYVFVISLHLYKSKYLSSNYLLLPFESEKRLDISNHEWYKQNFLTNFWDFGHSGSDGRYCHVYQGNFMSGCEIGSIIPPLKRTLLPLWGCYNILYRVDRLKWWRLWKFKKIHCITLYYA